MTGYVVSSLTGTWAVTAITSPSATYYQMLGTLAFTVQNIYGTDIIEPNIFIGPDISIYLGGAVPSLLTLYAANAPPADTAEFVLELEVVE